MMILYDKKSLTPKTNVNNQYGGNLNEKENNIIYINNYGADDGIFTRRL